jgi:hypothetical protein
MQYVAQHERIFTWRRSMLVRMARVPRTFDRNATPLMFALTSG